MEDRISDMRLQNFELSLIETELEKKQLLNHKGKLDPLTREIKLLTLRLDEFSPEEYAETELTEKSALAFRSDIDTFFSKLDEQKKIVEVCELEYLTECFSESKENSTNSNHNRIIALLYY